MFDFLESLGVTAVICLTIYKLFELFARRRERTLFIEKLTEIPIEKLQGNLGLPYCGNRTKTNSPSFLSLRVGLLILGVGFGLLFAYFLISTYLVDTVYHVDAHRTLKRIIVGSEEYVWGASVLFFGGIALLASFIIEQRLLRKRKEEDNSVEQE